MTPRRQPMATHRQPRHCVSCMRVTTPVWTSENVDLSATFSELATLKAELETKDKLLEALQAIPAAGHG